MQRTLAKLRNGEQVTIVALGDSNTEQTWHTRDRLNWVGLLQQALFQTYGRNTARVINAGLCGDTAAQAIGRLDRDVLRFEPNMVIVAFGMNDAMLGPAGLETHAAAIRTIVRTCRDRYDSDILLRTTTPMVPLLDPSRTDGAAPGREAPGMNQGLYTKRLVELAKELACPVVDHYTLWLARRFDEYEREIPNTLSLYMSDAVHPGPDGHMAMFRELAPRFDVPPRFCWEA
jgi:lysophospholipase L1-like esterase